MTEQYTPKFISDEELKELIQSVEYCLRNNTLLNQAEMKMVFDSLIELLYKARPSIIER